jgi:hypothetical protein
LCKGIYVYTEFIHSNIRYVKDTNEYYFTNPDNGDCGDTEVLPKNPSTINCPDNITYYRNNEGQCIFKCDGIVEKRNLANNRCDCIYENQEILIPKSGYSYYLTKSGDNLKDVLSLFNVNYDEFGKYNDKLLLEEGQLFAYKRL